MKAVVLFASAFVGGFVVFAAADLGTVGFERVSPGACVTGEVGWTNFPNNGGPLSNPSSSLKDIYCGVNDSNLFVIGGVQGKQNITTLNIHGADRHSSNDVWARACVSFFSSTGGECGTLHSSGNTFLGQYTLSPSLSKWGPSFSAHFGYIFIELPPFHSSNGSSTFSGYFVGAP